MIKKIQAGFEISGLRIVFLDEFAPVNWEQMSNDEKIEWLESRMFKEYQMYWSEIEE